MSEKPFGGEGNEVMGQPPYRPDIIYTRIDARALEALQAQNGAMKQWIKTAIPYIESLAKKLPPDDSLSYTRLVNIAKDLLDKMNPKRNPNASG